MKCEFRLANCDDLISINNIFLDAIQNMNAQNIFQWDELYPTLDIIKNDIRNNHMYVYLINDKPVSVVVINEQQELEYDTVNWTYTDEKIYVIHRLCVDAKVQGQGIGRKTMLLAEAEAIKKGYSSIRLDTFSQNPFALRLYKTLGYKCVGEINFRKGKFYCFEKLLIV